MNAATIHREFMRNGVVAIHAALTAVPFWIAIHLSISQVFKKIPENFTWFIANGSQAFWSYCALVLGFIGLVGLLARGKNTRLLSATLLGMGHAAMATGFYLGNPASLAIGTYAILAALSVWRIYLEA